MEVTQCRIVLFTPGDPNDVSAVESPAIVTRVNKADGENPETVDLTVFPPGAAPYPVSNVEQSSSGTSENAKWCWPQAAPTGSQPEGPGDGEPDAPEPETPEPETPTPPAGEGDGASTGDGSGDGGETPTEGEAPTTSAASEKPLYKVSGDELPGGFTLSGLETPEGATLYHYEGDTAGEAHKFDLATNAAITLYAEADDNDQPVKPVAEAAA